MRNALWTSGGTRQRGRAPAGNLQSRESPRVSTALNCWRLAGFAGAIDHRNTERQTGSKISQLDQLFGGRLPALSRNFGRREAFRGAGRGTEVGSRKLGRKRDSMRFDARLKRLESALTAKVATDFPEDCTCFPDDEQPDFRSSAESGYAEKVLCQLHGKRYKSVVKRHLYQAARFYRLDFELGWPTRSPQYQKAIRASFADRRLACVRNYPLARRNVKVSLGFQRDSAML